MCHIIVIVGLPGSGKSHYGRALAQVHDIPFFDDCLTETDAWISAVERITARQDCVLADPGFCIERQRSELIREVNTLTNDITLEYIYFANDPDTCAYNVSRREDGRAVSTRFVHSFSQWYTIPSDANIRPCYRGS